MVLGKWIFEEVNEATITYCQRRPHLILREGSGNVTFIMILENLNFEDGKNGGFHHNDQWETCLLI